jgi:hypothetical protein
MHLRVGTKIGLIIALLGLTAIGIAALGYYEIGLLDDQLRRLVEVSGRKVRLCGEMRLDLVIAVSTERAAIISDQDEESSKFKSRADEAALRIQKNLDALEEILKVYPSEEDRRNLDVFKRRWDRFVPELKEGLLLATQNTKAHARRLTRGEVADRVTMIDDALQGLLRQTDKEVAEAVTAKEITRLTGAEKKARAHGRARALALELHRQLYQHINTADDGERQVIEKYLASIQKDLGTVLRELATPGDDKSRPLLEQLSQEFGKVKDLVAQAK